MAVFIGKICFRIISQYFQEWLKDIIKEATPKVSFFVQEKNKPLMKFNSFSKIDAVNCTNNNHNLRKQSYYSRLKD